MNYVYHYSAECGNQTFCGLFFNSEKVDCERVLNILSDGIEREYKGRFSTDSAPEVYVKSLSFLHEIP